MEFKKDLDKDKGWCWECIEEFCPDDAVADTAAAKSKLLLLLLIERLLVDLFNIHFTVFVICVS